MACFQRLDNAGHIAIKRNSAFSYEILCMYHAVKVEHDVLMHEKVVCNNSNYQSKRDRN